MNEEKQNKEIETKRTLTREELMEILHDVLEIAQYKALHGRCKDVQREKNKRDWIKVLREVIDSYNQLLKDVELKELEKRIAALEQKER
ncbi:MAG: hypothetical protein ACXQS6_01520 [Candidatus Syntropharchaeales archaeon]